MDANNSSGRHRERRALGNQGDQSVKHLFLPPNNTTRMAHSSGTLENRIKWTNEQQINKTTTRHIQMTPKNNQWIRQLTTAIPVRHTMDHSRILSYMFRADETSHSNRHLIKARTNNNNKLKTQLTCWRPWK